MFLTRGIEFNANECGYSAYIERRPLPERVPYRCFHDMDVNRSLRCDGTGLALSFDARLNRGLYFATRDDKNEFVIQTQRKKRKKEFLQCVLTRARTQHRQNQPAVAARNCLSVHSQLPSMHERVCHGAPQSRTPGSIGDHNKAS